MENTTGSFSLSVLIVEVSKLPDIIDNDTEFRRRCWVSKGDGIWRGAQDLSAVNTWLKRTTGRVFTDKDKTEIRALRWIGFAVRDVILITWDNSDGKK